MIEYKLIDRQNRADINIPNEPFPIFGRMIPSYVNEKWEHDIELFAECEITQMCFPDENYDYDELAKDHVFVGAYDGDKCVGLAILREVWFMYMYLYDLKVNAGYRGKGIGKMLIDKSMEVAVSKGYRGLYTQGQDNNLAACKFYIKSGFHIGGLNTDVYKGTVQENKKDIYFYKDSE